MESAPSMTWLLVSTWPPLVITMPVPSAVPWPPARLTTMSTMAGSSLDSIEEASMLAPLLEPPEEPPPSLGVTPGLPKMPRPLPSNGEPFWIEDVGEVEPLLVARATTPADAPAAAAKRGGAASAGVLREGWSRGGGAGPAGQAGVQPG